MEQTVKNQIKKYLLDYLKKRIPDFKMKGKLFKCPNYHLHENKSEEYTCNEFPPNSGNLHCFAPSCGKLGNIIDLSRKIDFDGNEDVDEDDICNFLIKEFNIKINQDQNKIFDLYENLKWNMVPVNKNGKESWIEEAWQTKNHTDKIEWEQWINNGINIGVQCGNKSNVIGVDFDLIPSELKKRIYAGNPTEKQLEDARKAYDEGLLKIKEKMPYLDWTTLQQRTFGGIHIFYSYDDSIPKTAFDYEGIHIDIETDGGQIVIEPSIVSGQNRQIIGTEIHSLPKELKELILSKKSKVQESEIIKPPLNNVELTFENLNNNRNNTFISLYGQLRREMPIKTAYNTLIKFNGLLDKKVPLKELQAMARESEKYHEIDIQGLSEKIIEHCKLVNQEVHMRDLKEVLNIERGDIEQALRFLLDKNKIYKIKKDTYRLITDVEWRTDFLTLSKPLDIIVPYFHPYARFNQGSMIVIGGKTGTGKCFSKGTKILMYDGSLKEVEKIQINDKVMGINSQPRTVLKLDNGIDDLYKIIPTKGKCFTVNSKHILSLKKTGTNQTINIGLDEYLTKNKTFKHLHKLYRVPVKFNTTKVPFDPYFLGLWLGDGDSRDSRITNINKEVIDYLKKYAKQLKLKYVEYNYGARCSSHKLASKRKQNKNVFNLKNELRKLSLLQNKHIPTIYKINSRKNRLKLLAGLLDSDGYYNSGHFNIITKFKKLSDDIEFLAGSLGFLVTNRIKKIKYKNQIREYYSINIIGDVKQIPTKIKYKQAFKRKINKNPLYTGFKVQKIERGEFYGFELDGNSLHLIESFIVNHNSHLTVNFIEQFVKQGICPKLITTEADSGVGEIAIARGLKEGDFKFWQTSNPIDVPFKENEVRIIDWLKAPNSEFAKLDTVYEGLNNNLVNFGGLLIIFAQLRKENNTFWSENMVEQFASVVAKFNYVERNGIVDNLHPEFTTTKIRRPKTNKQYVTIPLEYLPETKEIKAK